METFLEIIKITIPAVVVFLTAYYCIKLFFKQETVKITEAQKTDGRKITLPIKVQAYERLVLFLERINPESLLLRTQTSHMSAGQLHSDLLLTIRAEFEHNLSQQIYVSSASWQSVKRAKESLLIIINEEASNISQVAPASALSQAIINRIIAAKTNPVQIAIDVLKIEASNFL